MKLSCLGITILYLFISLSCFNQVTIRVTTTPSNTPSKTSIYLAGNINGWAPGNAGFQLHPDSNGIPTITIPEGTGTVNFKFTRGSWETVETGGNNEDIANRSFSFTGSPQILNLSIQNWNGEMVASSTAASNVHILDTAFLMPTLNRTRKIWLYLPPDYDSTKKHYPVLYMHDGQNLFDKTTSYSGEWQVDETLNKLFAEGDEGAIVVGIENGRNQRLNEYSPWVNSKYGGGQGDAYIDFIAQNLKPYIDSHFRTKTDAANTCLFGSSMGGLISLYGVLKYPNVFGRAGVFSPSYWFNLASLNRYIAEDTNSISSLRIEVIGGEKESDDLVEQIQSVSNQLFLKGLPKANADIKIDADGAHNEGYWRREFGRAYLWLFRK